MSTAFASFDTHARSNAGINGALTPARPHRAQHAAKSINDIHTPSTTTLAYGTSQTPARRKERLVGGEGISLQETEARIDELERSEFDLKLKLFYMEEQLQAAVGGVDVLQLHREVMDAKQVGACTSLSALYTLLSAGFGKLCSADNPSNPKK